MHLSAFCGVFLLFKCYFEHAGRVATSLVGLVAAKKLFTVELWKLSCEDTMGHFFGASNLEDS